MDRDYRSDFSAHHSKAFISPAATTHRIHFFGRAIRTAHLGALPRNPEYRGYMVIRPREVARVGRTMLMPPPTMQDFVRVKGRDRVDLFGTELSVIASPFMAQDRELLRCAHVDSWMAHYSAYLNGVVGRLNSSWFALNPGPGIGRPIPSTGLDILQVSELLRMAGLPPVILDIEQLPRVATSQTLHWVPQPSPPRKRSKKQHPGYWDYRILRVCCRFLNSGLPVIVATAGHVFVLIGYERQLRPGQPDLINLIRHDDEVGPYVEVGDIFNDPDGYTPWQALIAPLPEHVWLSGDLAEYVAGRMMEVRSSAWSVRVRAAGRVSALISSRDLALRTYVRTSVEFKRGLASRGFDPDLERSYRLARMPKYVWVVEAIDRRLRRAGKPCVLGEVIFDATSTDEDYRVLAVHLPGVAAIYRTAGNLRFPLTCSPAPYGSGGVGPP